MKLVAIAVIRFEAVIAQPAEQHVRAEATPQRIRTALAVKAVIAETAFEHVASVVVGTGAIVVAVKAVVAKTASNMIVAAASKNQIVAKTGIDRVVAQTTHDQVGAGIAVNCVRCPRRRR